MSSDQFFSLSNYIISTKEIELLMYNKPLHSTSENNDEKKKREEKESLKIKKKVMRIWTENLYN